MSKVPGPTTSANCQRPFGCLLVLTILLAGCSFSYNNGNFNLCAYTGISVSPATATADHAALAPGNAQQFLAFGMVPPGCAAIASNLTNVTWSVSDAVNVTISNAKDQTFGVAKCVGATAGSVTVIATLVQNGKNVGGTAQLTCK